MWFPSLRLPQHEKEPPTFSKSPWVRKFFKIVFCYKKLFCIHGICILTFFIGYKRTQRGGFSFLVILELYGVPFHAAVVALKMELVFLFKSILTHWASRWHQSALAQNMNMYWKYKGCNLHLFLLLFQKLLSKQWAKCIRVYMNV